MFVIEHLERATSPLFSYEIIPPPRGKSAKDILDIVEQLLPFEPPFIDVTAHGAEATYEELDDGTIRRRIRKKRPGTLSICGIIQNRYKIDTVPHLLCHGFTKEETEDAMIELNYLGIHNVLAIRGDETNHNETNHNVSKHNGNVNAYASDLVRQLNDLKRGIYLEDIANSSPIEFCIGVGGYPEKHIESPNLKTDIEYLKRKVECGADYVVTQMFFDADDFIRFERRCRDAGITAPIIPGLKILNTKRQLHSLPKNFHVNIPEPLADEVMESPERAVEIGIDWGVAECEKLLSHGAKCLHFYVMNDTASVSEVVGRLRKA